MPVVEVKGDLLDSDCNVIAHCCNCFHVMGAGIAKQIKTRFPEVYQADLLTPRGSFRKLGTVSAGYGEDKLFFNCYAQWGYDASVKQIEYGALHRSLEIVHSWYGDNWLASRKLGMPRLGCGLAGGDWIIVKQIIEEVFHDTTVYVYSLQETALMWMYTSSFYPASQANALLALFSTIIPWEQNYYNNGGYKIRVPRKTCWFSPHSYSYAGVSHEKRPPDGIVQSLIYNMAERTGIPFNSVLMNYYQDHNDSVGFHDDNDYPNGGYDQVASVSLGAVRKFLIKNKRDQTVESILLEHGSLFLMQAGMQKLFQHSLPKSVTPCGPRINLTFRHVAKG